MLLSAVDHLLPKDCPNASSHTRSTSRNVLGLKVEANVRILPACDVADCGLRLIIKPNSTIQLCSLYKSDTFFTFK